MVVGDVATAAEVVVLGAGPGGYVAALRAAQLGKEVVVVDARPPGGACLHEGCIPAKTLLTAAQHFAQAGQLAEWGIDIGPATLNLPQMQRRKQAVVDKLARGIGQLFKQGGVKWVQGLGWFLDGDTILVEAKYGAQRFIFEQAVIAVGASAAPLPGRPFDGERVLTPAQALRLTELPAQLAIAGGDTIAVELATLFARLGSRVSLHLPEGGTLLPEFDPAAGRTLKVLLKKLGVSLYNGLADLPEEEPLVVSLGVRPNSAGLHLERVGIPPDAGGAIPVNDRQQTANPAIFAVGDVTGGAPLAHIAIKQGKVAAEVMAGLPARFEPQAVPHVAWTEPQVAAVGLTAEQAQSLGYRVATGRLPLGASGRALSLGQSDGFVLTVAEAGSELLLGVTVVGPQAETLIGEAALALEMGATLTDLAETLHPHPGLGEALQEAAEAALGAAVHIKG
ncbi:MAG: dihydrolipoyl dehydrogenase [Anaerolineae bacterium]